MLTRFSPLTTHQRILASFPCFHNSHHNSFLHIFLFGKNIFVFFSTKTKKDFYSPSFSLKKINKGFCLFSLNLFLLLLKTLISSSWISISAWNLNISKSNNWLILEHTYPEGQWGCVQTRILILILTPHPFLMGFWEWRWKGLFLSFRLVRFKMLIKVPTFIAQFCD